MKIGDSVFVTREAAVKRGVISAHGMGDGEIVGQADDGKWLVNFPARATAPSEWGEDELDTFP